MGLTPLLILAAIGTIIAVAVFVQLVLAHVILWAIVALGIASILAFASLTLVMAINRS